MASHVIPESSVEPQREGSDTVSLRVTLEAGRGLQQRVVRCDPGRSKPRRAGPGEELLFVVGGSGRVVLDGVEHELEPETGVRVGPGQGYELDNPGPGELVLVSVVAPPAESAGGDGGGAAVVVRLRDRAPQPAGRDREFRLGAEAAAVTQFVGTIPPGRAKPHYHEYEEVAYVLAGEGVLHMRGERTPVTPGSCIHFPPRVPHILENVGSGPLRVLGVFHPAGDPSMAFNVPDLEGEVR